LQIKTDDREWFLEKLTASLRKGVPLSPFHIQFSKLNWVPNFDRTRWFLILGIEKPPNDELNKLLRACNFAAEECGHPGLYTGGAGDGPMEQEQDDADERPPKRRRKSSAKGETAEGETENPDMNNSASVDFTDKFHVSIAWNLIEPDPAWTDVVLNMDVSDLVKPPVAPFEAVKVRIGNTVHSIPLGVKKTHIPSGALSGWGTKPS
jgi:hypothetical protein